MTELDKDLEQYILEHIDPEDKILYELNRVAHLKLIHPRMVSGHLQGQILRMLSYMLRPRRILEIGTFAGYSAICLAQGMPKDGHLHTIEINDELIDIPLQFFERAGLKQKITLHVGDACDIVPAFEEFFDLVFIDGDKSQYLDYYTVVFDKVRPGGFIFADNVLWNGKVLEQENSNDYSTKGIKKFNDWISSDNRVEKVILPIRDGLMMLRKK
ncbi:MAG: O-methyltransferase [Bacteroidota bacterium]|nr:O-methyltransferase [Bacteroidota bacterium]